MLLSGDGSVWSVLFFLGFISAFGTVYLSLQAALRRPDRRSLPRTISLADGELRIVTPKEEKRIKIADCKWYSGSTAADQTCMFTGLRRGVVIQTPEEQIAVGHAAGMLPHWQHFLTLARLKQNPPRGCLRLLVIAILGMAAGIILGLGIGVVVVWLNKESKSGNLQWGSWESSKELRLRRSTLPVLPKEPRLHVSDCIQGSLPSYFLCSVSSLEFWEVFQCTCVWLYQLGIRRN